MKQGTMMHMGMTKEYMRQMVIAKGAKYAGINHADSDVEVTKEMALEWLKEQPWEIYTGCSCKKNKDGSCSGYLE